MSMDCCHHFKENSDLTMRNRDEGDLVTLYLKEKVEKQRTKEDIAGECQLKKDLSTLITEKNIEGKKSEVFAMSNTDQGLKSRIHKDLQITRKR